MSLGYKLREPVAAIQWKGKNIHEIVDLLEGCKLDIKLEIPKYLLVVSFHLKQFRDKSHRSGDLYVSIGEFVVKERDRIYTIKKYEFRKRFYVDTSIMED